MVRGICMSAEYGLNYTAGAASPAPLTAEQQQPTIFSSSIRDERGGPSLLCGAGSLLQPRMTDSEALIYPTPFPHAQTEIFSSSVLFLP